MIITFETDLVSLGIRHYLVAAFSEIHYDIHMSQQLSGEHERNVIDRIIRRWSTYSELKLLAITLMLTVALPVVFLYIPAWSYALSNNFYGMENYTFLEIMQIIIFAPVLETLLLFLPVLEIARRLGYTGSRTAVVFALVFEALHYHRELYDHMYLFFVGLIFVMVYVALRRRSFLSAVVTTMSLHMFYNTIVLLIDPNTYA